MNKIRRRLKRTIR